VTPNVSVVIPTYNGVRFIREALESVFRQTLLPGEIIVVDDASGDETSHIVSSMIPSAPTPLRLIQLEVNSGGPARPLNIGIEAASGEYIAVLDQDDLFQPDKLQKQAGLLASHPHLVFAFSYCSSYTQPNRIMQPSSLVQELNTLSEKKEGYDEISSKNVLTLLIRDTNFIYGYPGFVFRRRDWKKKGGLEESLQITTDYEFLCWLALQGPAGLIPEISYLRREHGRNLSHRLYRISLEAIRIRIQYLSRRRELLLDKRLEQSLKNEFLGFILQYGETKYDATTLEYFHRYNHLWGWGKEIFSLAKLLPSEPPSNAKIASIRTNGQQNAMTISIIIIFKNAEKYLREAVESVFEQTFTDWELLLVDDGSTDSGTSIARELADQNPQRISYLHHEGHQNKGVNASWNLGLGQARGEFVAFLDSDDVWLPEKLERQLAFINQHPEVGLLASPAIYWYEDGKKEVQPMTLSPGRLPPGAWIPKMLENEDNAACPSMVLIKKDLALQSAGFEKRPPTLYEDQVMWCKATFAAPIYYYPECLGLYRIHSASRCQSTPPHQRNLASLHFNAWLTAFIPKQRNPGIQKSNLLILMSRAKLCRVLARCENGGASRLRGNFKKVLTYGPLLGWFFSGVFLLNCLSNRLAATIADLIFVLSRTAYDGDFFKKVVRALTHRFLGSIQRVIPQSVKGFAKQALNFKHALSGRIRLTVGVRPLSSLWGADRGLPIHRYYLEQFLRESVSDIRGHCLEFYEDFYTTRFGGPSVTRLDILHKDNGNPQATLVADLTQPNPLPENYFDCIICTHVLHVIFELNKAVSELYRILKPGGVLLVGVPHVSMCDPNWHEIWRFTPEGLSLALSKVFGEKNVGVRAYGNSLTAAGEIRGLSATEFTPAELGFSDPRFAVEVCARAVKSRNLTP